jgi:WhiB family redox-sensing transcriptional regulator
MRSQAKTPVLFRRAAMDWINPVGNSVVGGESSMARKSPSPTRRRQEMKQRGGADLAVTRRQTREIGKENWRSAAACRSADPELFFPVSHTGKSLEQVIEAKEICAGCPVRCECLAFALRTLQAYGIWGGTTEEERAIARQRPSR